MTILHVEDNEALAAIFEWKYPNLKVSEASTLARALEMLSEESFDAILLDLGLPDSKGLDTVKAMVNRGVPVVITTANTDGNMEKMCLKAGAADFIHKKDFPNIDVEARLRDAAERHARVKRRYSSFSFGDIEPMKRFISCPPFETRSSRDARREAVMA